MGRDVLLVAQSHLSHSDKGKAGGAESAPSAAAAAASQEMLWRGRRGPSTRTSLMASVTKIPETFVTSPLPWQV